MLIVSRNLIGQPVMSLQTGQPLAKIDAAIINPGNLKIVAFYVSGPMVDFSPAVLFADDIRELSNMGVIVDSSDNIMSPEGMVRLNEVIEYKFELIGCNVIDDHKHRLGRVEDYTLNPDDLMVQQLYLKPTLMKSLSLASLTISRDQIIAIDNQLITVKTPTVHEKVTARVNNITDKAVPFENPFRKPNAAPENIDRD